jgi:hypothetical protein
MRVVMSTAASAVLSSACVAHKVAAVAGDRALLAARRACGFPTHPKIRGRFGIVRRIPCKFGIARRTP